MKNLVSAIGALLFSLGCVSQKTTLIDCYHLLESPESYALVVEMSFAKTDILKISGDTSNLKKAGDIFIDVICTDYPSNLSLKELNKKRVLVFMKRFSFLRTSQVTEINFLRQSEGAERDKAISMFHGLVIHYRPRQSPEAMKADLASLDQIIDVHSSDTLLPDLQHPTQKDSILLKLKLKSEALKKDTGPVKYEARPYDMCVMGYVGYKHFPDDSSINISPRLALKKGLISKAAYKAYNWSPMVTLFFRRISNRPVEVTMPVQSKLPSGDTLKYQPVPPLPDSTVLKIFARIKWSNFTVVEDVTVSMYPYSAQLLLWLRLHRMDSVTRSFVFFNDGDDMPDEEKKTGSTGGIYSKECYSFDQVKKLIRQAMEKGSGGDRAENDIEALLQGEKDFPSSAFQVLIADNHAPVKDKSLMQNLLKPVYVVLCGANDYNINTDYLDLARQTHGSLHLIDQDIDDLASLREGELLRIGTSDYKIDKGRFIEVETIPR